MSEPVDLQDDGVLWLINRGVFHPRGFALAIQVEDDGTISGWSLVGDGSEPWTFSEADDDEKFAAVERLFSRATQELWAESLLEVEADG